MNVIENSIALFTLFFIMLMLSVTYYILDPIVENTGKTIEETQGMNIISSTWGEAYYSLKSLILSLFYVVVSLIVLIGFITSTFDGGNYFYYLIKTMITMFMVPILIYISSMVLSTFVDGGFGIDDLQMAFVNNWNLILIANFFMGLLSFIFVRRGDEYGAYNEKY